MNHAKVCVDTPLSIITQINWNKHSQFWKSLDTHFTLEWSSAADCAMPLPGSSMRRSSYFSQWALPTMRYTPNHQNIAWRYTTGFLFSEQTQVASNASTGLNCKAVASLTTAVHSQRVLFSVPRYCNPIEFRPFSLDTLEFGRLFPWLGSSHQNISNGLIR